MAWRVAGPPPRGGARGVASPPPFRPPAGGGFPPPRGFAPANPLSPLSAAAPRPRGWSSSRDQALEDGRIDLDVGGLEGDPVGLYAQADDAGRVERGAQRR